jgi:hypothetical protein
MGYFAVIGDPSGVEVVRCHINVWAFDGLLRQPVFYFDVGLGFRNNGGEPLREVQLALPFSVVDGSDAVRDLRPLILERDTAMLIFGEPMTISGDGHLDGGGLALDVVHVDAQPVRERCTARTSVWTIKFASPVASDHAREAYVRLRFRVRSFARAWTRQSSGALFDFRICDLRESVNDASWGSLETRILPIKKAYFFLIVPARLKSRAVSPPFRYMRLLEGSRWERYLGRRVQLVGHKKLAIYYWKAPEAAVPPAREPAPIDASHPLRVFVDLSEDGAHLKVAAYLGVFIAASAAVVATPTLSKLIGAGWNDLHTHTVALISALGVAGVAKLIFSIYRDSIDYVVRGRSVFWKLDRFVYWKSDR